MLIEISASLISRLLYFVVCFKDHTWTYNRVFFFPFLCVCRGYVGGCRGLWVHVVVVRGSYWVFSALFWGTGSISEPEVCILTRLAAYQALLRQAIFLGSGTLNLGPYALTTSTLSIVLSSKPPVKLLWVIEFFRISDQNYKSVTYFIILYLWASEEFSSVRIILVGTHTSSLCHWYIFIHFHFEHLVNVCLS